MTKVWVLLILFTSPGQVAVVDHPPIVTSIMTYQSQGECEVARADLIEGSHARNYRIQSWCEEFAVDLQRAAE